MDSTKIQIEKKTFMGVQGEFVNETVFSKYVEKYGEDRAIAYLQAMNDFTRQLEVILGGGFVRNGLTTTGKKLQKEIEGLVDHNCIFLKNHFDEKNDIVVNQSPSI